MSSETRRRDHDQPATGVSSPDDADRAAQATTDEDERLASRRSRRFPSSRLSAGERNMIAQKARDFDFPVAMRGYERGAVDRYVQQVNRLIAERGEAPEAWLSTFCAHFTRGPSTPSAAAMQTRSLDRSSTHRDRVLEPRASGTPRRERTARSTASTLSTGVPGRMPLPRLKT